MEVISLAVPVVVEAFVRNVGDALVRRCASAWAVLVDGLSVIDDRSVRRRGVGGHQVLRLGQNVRKKRTFYKSTFSLMHAGTSIIIRQCQEIYLANNIWIIYALHRLRLDSLEIECDAWSKGF